jgi:hypothetical protein
MCPLAAMTIEELRRLNIAGLKQKYLILFGAESKSSNNAFLFRRIPWKMQAQVEGGLSERALQRAAEIADEADLPVRAPKGFLPFDAPSRLGGRPFAGSGRLEGSTTRHHPNAAPWKSRNRCQGAQEGLRVRIPALSVAERGRSRSHRNEVE